MQTNELVSAPPIQPEFNLRDSPTTFSETDNIEYIINGKSILMPNGNDLGDTDTKILHYHANDSNDNSNSTIDTFDKDKSSIEMGIELFQSIMHPVKIDEFFKTKWEKSPLLIKRSTNDYYQHLLSITDINKILLEDRIEYTTNLDITSYVDGVRETHNLVGRALPSVVWNFYESGCSLRLLNPQTFLPKIHKLNSVLQEFFQCMVGANVYLTPPNSQGFAPHYDDIEAFVLQIEGEKLWKLYSPRNQNEYLPRESSKNFNESEIGEPILCEILQAGDLLYFPRGTIHQAQTVTNKHSLHITLSFYQKNSYGDLFEILLQSTLKKAMDNDIEYRRGLPLNIWQNMGIVYENDNNTIIQKQEQQNDRKLIMNKIKKLYDNMFKYLDVDNAVDQMALKYQHDALPPLLCEHELKRTVYGTDTKFNVATGNVKEYTMKWNGNVKIRLLRANVLRLTSHEDGFRVYFNVDNSKEYHQYELNYLEISTDDISILTKLIKSYPKYIKINELSTNSVKHNIEVVNDLWASGLLIVDQ